MNTVKHLFHGIVAFVASLIPLLTGTHTSTGKSTLLSLIPAGAVALASAFGDNITLSQAAHTETAVGKIVGPLLARVEALEAKKPTGK